MKIEMPFWMKYEIEAECFVSGAKTKKEIKQIASRITLNHGLPLSAFKLKGMK